VSDFRAKNSKNIENWHVKAPPPAFKHALS